MKKLTERLYESVEEIWSGFHEHPFVTGLGEGTLAVEKFRFYMIQDYLYLYEYAKVFALGVVKAKEPALMRKLSWFVEDTINGEMNIHKAYMEKLGISEAETASVVQSLANASYTSYMIQVGYNGGLLDILTAILSCAWSYKEIGENLNKKYPNAVEHELYGDWVRGYISKEYVQMNQDILDLIDRLGADISEQRVRELQEIFVNCSRFEGMFWDMAFDMSK